MGISITINKIDEFKYIESYTEYIQEITLDGRTAREKVILSNENSNEGEYKKFKVKYTKKHHQKRAVNVSGSLVNEWLDDYIFEGYKKSNDYFITVSDIPYRIVHSGMKKLKKKRKVMCDPLQVNLIEFVEKIITQTTDIEIAGGWFGNLGLPNLDSVKLQGDDVNRSSDWSRFKTTEGAKINSVNLVINTEKFDNLKLMLSSKGFIYLQTNDLTVVEALELSEYIIELINR